MDRFQQRAKASQILPKKKEKIFLAKRKSEIEPTQTFGKNYVTKKSCTINDHEMRSEGLLLDKKEDEYHVRNIKLRARIRLKDGRPEPFDTIVRNFSLALDFGMDPEPPFKICLGLSYAKLEDVAHDVTAFHKSSGTTNNFAQEFWKNMIIVLHNELELAKATEDKERIKERGLSTHVVCAKAKQIHAHLEEDVSLILQDKTTQDYSEIENEISNQLERGSLQDPDYWLAILEKIGIHRARARLTEIHDELFCRFLEKRHEEGINAEENPMIVKTEKQTVTKWPVNETIDAKDYICTSYNKNYSTHTVGETATIERLAKVSPDHNFSDGEVMDPEQDLQELTLLRSQLANQSGYTFRSATKSGATPLTGDIAYRAMLADPQSLTKSHSTFRTSTVEEFCKAPFKNNETSRTQVEPLEIGDETYIPVQYKEMRKCYATGNKSCVKMEDEELNNMNEAQHQAQIYWWHDKYRPRKPKYFNRVHTGYEWNKYNQTHYDSDNPPPKVVMGYKFNIFYPDLIDKTKAPEYYIEKDPDSKDGSTCIIRFHAGAPYEDIAFKLVNKNWDTAPKKGFRCMFERCVLHLYFNFMRLRYRR